MWNLQCLVWREEGCLPCSATQEDRAYHTLDWWCRRGHFDLPCVRDFACSSYDRWCEIRFGRSNTSWKQENFHACSARAPCWSSQKLVSIGEPAGALSGEGHGVDMVGLRSEEVQRNQSSQYRTQKTVASRHKSTVWLCFVQGFFARHWFCLPARPAHCMHISCCIAARHHQSGGHVRKRCGACFCHFGLLRLKYLVRSFLLLRVKVC